MNFAFATSLVETGAATGIANTLQGIAQPNPVKHIDQAKKQVEKHDRSKQQKVNNIDSIYPSSMPNVPNQDTYDDFSQETDYPDRTPDSVENYSEKEFNSGNGYREIIKSVDFKEGMQVFYKEECNGADENCQRHPVLTNIKSVIFDYAYSRGNFEK